jgi:hypothetical protein
VDVAVALAIVDEGPVELVEREDECADLEGGE